MNKTENAFYIVGLLLALALVLLVFAACVMPVGAWDGDDGETAETPTRKPPPEQWTLVPTPTREEPPATELIPAKTEDNSTLPIAPPAVAYPVAVEGYPVEVSDPQPEPVGTPEPSGEPETVGKPAPKWTPEPAVWVPKYIAVFEWGVLAKWMK
jgi:hypothetical protein